MSAARRQVEGQAALTSDGRPPAGSKRPDSTARATWTDAAYLAGFASPAHLSDSFKDMFGLAPSRLLALGVTLRDEAHE